MNEKQPKTVEEIEKEQLALQDENSTLDEAEGLFQKVGIELSGWLESHKQKEDHILLTLVCGTAREAADFALSHTRVHARSELLKSLISELCNASRRRVQIGQRLAFLGKLRENIREREDSLADIT